MTVVALYVETGGVYFDLPDVEPWDESRDARTYAGPHPVVAHPPCNKWSPLAFINQRRLADYRVGDDGGCFAAALAAVRRWGGVLEHPAGSLAWRHFALPRPTRGAWTRTLTDAGWVNRGFSVRLRPPGQEANVALLRRPRAAVSAMGRPACHGERVGLPSSHPWCLRGC